MVEDEKPSNSYLRALARGINVIRAFDHNHPRLTLSQAAELTGLTRANARRILLTLETLGYVERENRYFVLRPAVLELGYSYLSSSRIAQISQPFIDALVERTSNPGNLALLDGTDIIYVVRSSTSHAPVLRMPASVGIRIPAYVTPLGRALLGLMSDDELDTYFKRATIIPFTHKTVTDPAELRRIFREDAARGWSFVAGEHLEFIAGIAAPVTDAQGRGIAAIGLGWVFGSDGDHAIKERLLPELLQTAESLSRRLRSNPDEFRNAKAQPVLSR